jgi:hypothetical protein
MVFHFLEDMNLTQTWFPSYEETIKDLLDSILRYWP